jgi:hypothetical protein
MKELKTKWYWKYTIGVIVIFIVFLLGKLFKAKSIDSTAIGTISNPQEKKDENKTIRINNDINNLLDK